MPELPEVETIRAGLEPYIRGKEIKRIETYHLRVSRHDPDGFTKFSGETISEVARRGKYLWFRIGQTQALVAHLRMSGQFRINLGHIRICGRVFLHGRAPSRFS
ncbi:DNA-formamidopyrimidine glycosylase family protein [Arcanobacterium hippocoleae]|uniref:DNA-formamidopyrimidine glycosylase family protein n=1 Tax=Arcanobacterium hippocoleae TaxID=149017 RepID=UPI00334294DA